MKTPENEAMITEFLNNVFCRNISNQHKAEKLWEEVKKSFNSSVAREFRLDWYHYMNNTLDHSGMERAVNELKRGRN